MKHHDTVVVGAGLTGLSFAYHHDRSVPIFEAEGEVGGMARTIDVNGYKLDLAPHLLHLSDAYVRELVLKTLKLPLTTHQRKATIYFRGRIIPYPFELNLLSVDERIRDECIAELPDRRTLGYTTEDELRAGSYRDYVLAAFGKGIAHHYLLPYNKKIWDTDPAEMTCEWMRYLPTADVDMIRRNAFHPNADAFGYNTEFYYPSDGGIRRLAEALAAPLSNIHLRTPVTAISTGDRYIEFSTGDRVGYDRLISTMPLRELIRMSDLDELRATAEKLIYTSVYVINIVVHGQVPEGIHWMYFPDRGLSFYRISFPKNYWRGATAGREQVLAVEIGRRDHRLSAETLAPHVVREVRNLSILKIDKVLSVHCVKIPVAYCIYDRKRTKAVDFIRRRLLQKGIVSLGRYGSWEYSAMQDAILQGKNLSLGQELAT